MADLVGKSLGKYKIVARLGRGGMAEVYKVYQPGLNRYVAIKVMLPHLSSDPQFRGKFQAALEKSGLVDEVPGYVWSKAWVVHCQPVGSGEATLKYLAPYIFRVALNNRRIVKIDNDQVTFWYQDSQTKKRRFCTLPVEEFMRRFLQHVLPKGFVKVRYYGFFSPSYRPLLCQLRLWLPEPQFAMAKPACPALLPKRSCRCPTCGQSMRMIATLKGVVRHRSVRLPPPIPYPFAPDLGRASKVNSFLLPDFG